MKNRHQNKDAERVNPCLKEQNLSYDCLDKNNFNHEKCEKYFENYNTCKKFWGKVYRDRKAKGLHPYLPDVEDREAIKKEYLSRNHSSYMVMMPIHIFIAVFQFSLYLASINT